MEFEIIKTGLLEEYIKETKEDLEERFHALEDAELSTGSFSFYTSVASVFSSKIEGEEIELDSYVKYKRFGIEFLPDYTRKIDDLYDAYTFAKTSLLNEANVCEAHRLSGRHIVAKHFQGKYRIHNMYVMTPEGQIEYVTASPYQLSSEMKRFYHDVDILLSASLTVAQTFFFASMLHLVFVKIHPWNDGNGRTARLVEKWFLSEKLGPNAWFLQSEKLYYNEHQTYYNNIRKIGLEYQALNYSEALPFLLMLQKALYM